MDLNKFKDPTKVRVPADLMLALKSNRKAEETWKSATLNMRRDWILWIVTGKLKETRGKRIGKAISMLSKGKRKVCCFAGINWLLKNEK